MITLTFPDGAKRQVEPGVSAAQVAASISKSLEKKAVAAIVDGTLTDLADPISSDSTLRIVTRDIKAYEAFYLDHLSKLPYVQSINSSVTVTVIKETTVLPL